MKQVFGLTLATAMLVVAGCKDHTESRYYDLDKEEYVELEKDENSGKMVDAKTRETVIIYVDKKNNDTIYGPTGEVINGYIVKTGDGKFKYDSGAKVKYDDDGDYKYKDGDYKKKVDADGDVKIEMGDEKKKIDGETGQVKHK